ncbi:MAG: hypothetical protein SNG57_01930 [Rikenellaceae bacterium]
MLFKIPVFTGMTERGDGNDETRREKRKERREKRREEKRREEKREERREKREERREKRKRRKTRHNNDMKRREDDMERSLYCKNLAKILHSGIFFISL